MVLGYKVLLTDTTKTKHFTFTRLEPNYTNLIDGKEERMGKRLGRRIKVTLEKKKIKT